LSTPFQPAQNDAAEPTPEILTPAPSPGLLPRETPVFSGLDVLLIFVAGIVLVAIVPAVALIAAHMLPRYAGVPLTSLAKNAVILIPAQAVAYLLLVAFIHLLMIARHDRGLTDVIPFAWPRKSWLALAGGAVVLAIAVLLLESVLPVPKDLPMYELFKTRSSAFVMLVFAVLVAPIVEELLFRGLLYPVLNRSLGVPAALVLTSIGFALLHASQLALAWAPLLTLFLVGMVLTLVRARYQSVLASTLVHMTYNATLFTVILLQTRGFSHMDAFTR
jgi:membrane protease YdiL (CAAX protease family)